ncbi:MAG: heliorhodopsin HeR [Acidimicrobiales bacterium]|nr:heliorhodopsin HeR [Acidimicrobiales bacterium]
MIELTASRATNLRRWNLGLTLLHGAQAALILALTSSFAITITTSPPTGPPGTPASAPDSLVDVVIGPVVALFLVLAAVDHLLTATVARDAYERDLRRGINRFRWVEYSVSATIMVLLIAAYSGITGITTLVAIAGANVAMILFGWLQETTNPPDRTTTSMTPFWFGTVAGITPWIAIWFNTLTADTVPGFVYGIVIVETVLFFSFGLTQWLQYRQVGPWADYFHGEKTYLVLSLVAKSLLAWQIYGGSLAPEG